MSREELIDRAFAIFHSANLTAFEHSRLRSVFISAIDKKFALQFLLDSIKDVSDKGEDSVEDRLRSIIKNLHSLAEKCKKIKYLLPFVPMCICPCSNMLRLGSADFPSVSTEVISALKERQNGVCYVSGKSDTLKATYIISPSILDDKDIQPGVRSASSILLS